MVTKIPSRLNRTEIFRPNQLINARMLSFCDIYIRSELNPSLRPYPRLKWMFDLGHLGDEIRGFDQFWRRVAAGDNNMKSGLSFTNGANLGQDFIDWQHAVTQHVNQFIKDEQIVITTSELLNTQIPGVARGLAILFRVLRVPGEAIAHRMNFDAQLLSRDMFAVAIVARLHELNHAAPQTLARRPHHQAQRARGLSFAVSGVDDQEAARVFLVISAAPFIFAFDHHKSERPAVAGR